MALFTPSKGKNKRGKRQNERGKTRNFLIFFVKILVKRAKTRIERRGTCTVLAVQSMVLCRSTAQNYPIDYHYLTNKHYPFPNNFQKPDPVIIGHGHYRSRSLSVTVIFVFGGANLPYKYYINICLYIYIGIALFVYFSIACLQHWGITFFISIFYFCSLLRPLFFSKCRNYADRYTLLSYKQKTAFDL